MRGSVAAAAAISAVSIKSSASAPVIRSPFDMRPFETWILEKFEPTVRLGKQAGHYARKPGEGLELYGVADMASIFYTLNRLNADDAARKEWADAFQTFQRASDGWLIEQVPTHDPLHNTAYALASMQLLDLRPRYPVKPPENDDPKAFLQTIDWEKNVYLGSHRGAGLGSIRYIVPELNQPEWFKVYFETCDSLFDRNNGLMGKNKPAGGDFDQVGGTFHYSFLYETFHRRMPFPEARIDAIIGLQQPDGYWDKTNHLWLTLDAIYMMTRTLRHAPHRFENVGTAVRRALTALMDDVYGDAGRVRSFGGQMPTHSVMAAVSFLAEAQIFLGSDQVITERPLRLVLDRRPFI
jgi:hypothetical protein